MHQPGRISGSDRSMRTLMDADLRRPRMHTYLDKKQGSDYILFDIPPINPVTDATALIRLTENAVLVCKCGTTITSKIKELQRILQISGILKTEVSSYEIY